MRGRWHLREEPMACGWRGQCGICRRSVCGFHIGRGGRKRSNERAMAPSAEKT